MAFIGDSVARNHMDSLLCLLSTEETPVNVYKDSDDRFLTWHFPHHDFTLMVLRSNYLISSKEILINGSSSACFELHLDKVSDNWSRKLPAIDYAIISAGHWFFRKLYLYEAGVVTGCVYCDEPNVTAMSPGFALRMSFRAALNHINECKECRKGLMTVLRTFSPAHFENGSWNNGGSCNRTSPQMDLGNELGGKYHMEMELRKVQLEEIEKARNKHQEVMKKRFEVLDVTKAMVMRPDGHPRSHWYNKWMKGCNDCLHWCLPGPIDVWSDFLMAMLRKEKAALSLD